MQPEHGDLLATVRSGSHMNRVWRNSCLEKKIVASCSTDTDAYRKKFVLTHGVPYIFVQNNFPQGDTQHFRRFACCASYSAILRFLICCTVCLPLYRTYRTVCLLISVQLYEIFTRSVYLHNSPVARDQILAAEYETMMTFSSLLELGRVIWGANDKIIAFLRRNGLLASSQGCNCA